MELIIDAQLDPAWNALSWHRNQTQPLSVLRDREKRMRQVDRRRATVSPPEMRRAGSRSAWMLHPGWDRGKTTREVIGRHSVIMSVAVQKKVALHWTAVNALLYSPAESDVRRCMVKPLASFRVGDGRASFPVILAALGVLFFTGCGNAIEKIQSPDPNIRIKAAMSFTKGASDKEVEELSLLLLTNKNSDVRYACALALGYGKCSKAVPSLIKALSDEHWLVRRSAVEALTRIGDARASQPLVPMLSDKEEEIRIYAARAFQQIKNKEVVSLLIHLAVFDNPNKWARIDDMNESLAGALGFQGDQSALPVLSKLLDDRCDKVARMAADAVGSIVGQEFKEEVMISRGFAVRLGSPSKARAWLQQHPELLQSTRRNGLQQIERTGKLAIFVNVLGYEGS
ncbi:MAG: HEAT repeat domain-containing protein [Verrucomicrobia bacterium]|nr:HEAT repeat domain-containing protein [Verrucomicrobiota bacterium]